MCIILRGEKRLKTIRHTHLWCAFINDVVAGATDDDDASASERVEGV